MRYVRAVKLVLILHIEVIAHCLIVKYANLHICGEILQFACLWNVRYVTMGWGTGYCGGLGLDI